jgi:hypothetical protein
MFKNKSSHKYHCLFLLTLDTNHNLSFSGVQQTVTVVARTKSGGLLSRF